MSGYFTFDGMKVAFKQGETIAFALLRQNASSQIDGTPPRYFCGIGCCQGCVVDIVGTGAREACLTPASDGLEVNSIPLAALERSGDR